MLYPALACVNESEDEKKKNKIWINEYRAYTHTYAGMSHCISKYYNNFLHLFVLQFYMEWLICVQNK